MRKNKNQGKTLEEAIQEQLANKDFRIHYEREQVITKIAYMVSDIRQAMGLTQTELAKRVGTSQSVIARLEGGNDSRIPSLDLLNRIATAMNSHVVISIEHNLTPNPLRKAA